MNKLPATAVLIGLATIETVNGAKLSRDTKNKLSELSARVQVPHKLAQTQSATEINQVLSQAGVSNRRITAQTQE